MKRALPFHSNAVWPPVWVVVSFIVVYGLFNAVVWLIAAASRIAQADISDMKEMVAWRNGLLAIAAGGYALYRLGRFHPVCNRGYRAWLTLTPWTADKPLPLGPVHLVWQDAIVVGALTAIAGWHAHVNPLLPAGVFGLVYCGGMTLLLDVTSCPASCLLLGFLWPALMLPAMSGWPMIGLIAVLLAVIWQGYQKSLKAFPMAPRSGKSIWQTEVSIDGVSNVGWPYKQLSPKFSFNPVPISRSAFLSVLIGWWCYCVIVRFQLPPVPALIVLFAALAALTRLMVYSRYITPPFNLWGRLVAGRFIVPEFDQVFLTPLAVVLLAIVGSIIIGRSGSWYPEVESCVFATVWFALLGGGPTYQKWILTGQHRYRPPPRSNANKQLLRSI
jgi:hypothetical protein